MKERRRNSRIPIKLELELRRGQWENYLTEDISQRGLFIRMAGPCALRQLLQVRVRLPGDPAPLEMMARVVRREAPWTSLQRAQLPGVGMEFFCLSEDVLRRWDGLIRSAQGLLDETPHLDAFSLSRQLALTLPSEQDEARREGGPPSTLGAPRPPSSRRKKTASGSVYILRAQNLERLERFVTEELTQGFFCLGLPYEIKTQEPASLRVIHPHTQEEFVLHGRLEHGSKDVRSELRFEGLDNTILRAFQSFIQTGQAAVL